jgi:hypothetical protein
MMPFERIEARDARFEVTRNSSDAPVAVILPNASAGAAFTESS